MHHLPSTPKRTIGKVEQRDYVERTAVRVVLQNDVKEVVIIAAKKGNYLKLPGGGVEGDEDHLIAAEREAMEETGCTVRVVGGCIAIYEEWRNNDLHQLSYCYLARLVEDTKNVQLTQDEIEAGLQHE